jgi:hypothetical protein
MRLRKYRRFIWPAIVIGVVAASISTAVCDYVHYSRLSHAGRRLHIGMTCDELMEAIGKPNAVGKGALRSNKLDAYGQLRIFDIGDVWTYTTIFDWDGVPDLPTWKWMPYWLERMSPGRESCDTVFSVWFNEGRLVSVDVPYRGAGTVKNVALPEPRDAAAWR